MSEADLVRLCQAGDVPAFEQLVERYKDMAVRTAYIVTGRRDLAEDIAQEAFVQCFYSIKRLRRAEFFKTWFYRILVRTGWRMASRAGKPVQINLDGEEGRSLSGGVVPAEAFEAREAGEAAYQAVSGLKKPMKEVVVLHYLNGFTIREIAEVLGCREGTVKSRLHKARKLLAEDLRQKGWEVDSRENTPIGKECGFDAKTSTV